MNRPKRQVRKIQPSAAPVENEEAIVTQILENMIFSVDCDMRQKQFYEDIDAVRSKRSTETMQDVMGRKNWHGLCSKAQKEWPILTSLKKKYRPPGLERPPPPTEISSEPSTSRTPSKRPCKGQQPEPLTKKAKAERQKQMAAETRTRAQNRKNSMEGSSSGPSCAEVESSPEDEDQYREPKLVLTREEVEWIEGQGSSSGPSMSSEPSTSAQHAPKMDSSSDFEMAPILEAIEADTMIENALFADVAPHLEASSSLQEINLFEEPSTSEAAIAQDEVFVLKPEKVSPCETPHQDDEKILPVEEQLVTENASLVESITTDIAIEMDRGEHTSEKTEKEKTLNVNEASALAELSISEKISKEDGETENNELPKAVDVASDVPTIIETSELPISNEIKTETDAPETVEEIQEQTHSEQKPVDELKCELAALADAPEDLKKEADSNNSVMPNEEIVVCSIPQDNSDETKTISESTVTTKHDKRFSISGLLGDEMSESSEKVEEMKKESLPEPIIKNTEEIKELIQEFVPTEVESNIESQSMIMNQDEKVSSNVLIEEPEPISEKVEKLVKKPDVVTSSAESENIERKEVSTSVGLTESLEKLPTPVAPSLDQPDVITIDDETEEHKAQGSTSTVSTKSPEKKVPNVAKVIVSQPAKTKKQVKAESRAPKPSTSDWSGHPFDQGMYMFPGYNDRSYEYRHNRRHNYNLYNYPENPPHQPRKADDEEEFWKDNVDQSSGFVSFNTPSNPSSSNEWNPPRPNQSYGWSPEYVPESYGNSGSSGDKPADVPKIKAPQNDGSKASSSTGVSTNSVLNMLARDYGSNSNSPTYEHNSRLVTAEKRSEDKEFEEALAAVTIDRRTEQSGKTQTTGNKKTQQQLHNTQRKPNPAKRDLSYDGTQFSPGSSWD